MILYDHLCGIRNSDWVLKKAVDFILCTPLNIIQDFGALGVGLFYLITGFLFLHTNRKKENCIASACRKVIRLYLDSLYPYPDNRSHRLSMYITCNYSEPPLFKDEIRMT